MTRKITIGIGVLFALLIVVAAVRAFVPVSTPPFYSSEHQPSPNSIAITEVWNLNGIDQSVVIRGRDATNPVLIWVGDLLCETPALRHFNSGLEDHFVVVYWCQRYTGQSFTPFAARPDRLSIDDYESDLDALVLKVDEKLHANKAVIVGHSSGTIIGLRYALHHPSHVAAYVGVGQVVDQGESLRRSYVFAIDEARTAHNGDAVTELERIGPPPYRNTEWVTLRKWVITFGGAFHNDLSYAKLVRISMLVPEANWRDIAAFVWGVEYTESVSREMAAVRFDGPSMHFDVPIYLLSGKYDHRTDAALAQEFIGKINAPRKEFIRFNSSAHSPPFEEPEAFNAWMVANVSDVAGSSSPAYFQTKTSHSASH